MCCVQLICWAYCHTSRADSPKTDSYTTSPHNVFIGDSKYI